MDIACRRVWRRKRRRKSLFSCLVAAVFCVMILVCPVSGQCQMDTCISGLVEALPGLGPEFESVDFSSAGSIMREATQRTLLLPPFCRLIIDCYKCLEATAGSCYADLNFRSAQKFLRGLREEFGCTNVNTSNLVLGPGVSGRRLKCTFVAPELGGEDDRDEEFCALFGDPHLLGFDEKFRSCGAEGAWPLVDTEFFAVQVTSARVCSTCRSTAVTRATVIVKDAGECGPQLTYEASSDALPNVFNDGTIFAGADKSVVVKEIVEGREVEIFMRHAGAIVSLRRIGTDKQFPSLSVTIRVPRAVVAPTGATTTELCVSGCLDELPGPEATLGINVDDQQATSLCLRRGLTDGFLDACVFDLMTTGDTAFADAAQFAMLDLRGSLKNFERIIVNRTIPQEAAIVFSGVNRMAASRFCLAYLILVALSVYFR